MSKIVILDEKTANQIAAGEVIERPASVVKEMTENSIDAGATQITVEIRNGGVSYIRVTDNGSGMEADDVEMAFERHATSKIRRIEDLGGLATMGFRGEALASVASVSRMEVSTKTAQDQNGINLRTEGGKVISLSQTGCPTGTTFIVRDLFYNTPARYKFLKKDATEAGYVSDIMERLALAHAEISFKYIQNNQVQLHTPGNNDLLSVIYSIYGKEIARGVLPVDYENEGIGLSGFVGKPEIARGTRGRQSIFLNGRYIKSHIITGALEEAYKTMLMQNKFPFCVLLLKVSPESFDVNVHPQKLEVRFANDRTVYSTIYNGVKNTLLGASLIRSIETAESPAGLQKPEKNAGTFARNQETLAGAGTRLQTGIPPKVHDFKTELPGLGQASPFKRAHEEAAPAENAVLRESPSHGQVQNAAKKTEKKEFTSEYAALMPEPAGSPVGEPELSLYNVPVTKETSLNQLQEAFIVGQAFDTYIILQNGDNLFIIDQHAAHERIRYETLKLRLEKGENFSQGILEPFIIKLQAKEFNFAMEKQGAFQKLGFDLEAFGPNTIILRSIPDIYDSSFSVSDFHEILDRWIKTDSSDSGISDETLYMMSCKGAIKANRPLSKEEINNLVETLCSMENPFTCVHGRPIIINVDKKEFEKKFKRIV
ncbi:MAG TPA: DNA mismatch repair endonuclease MutL [Ruminiclostridium sp.]|nr:DNA mismatch repair endonuclease MutL [Ruminiclostridium sp.]